MTRPDIDTILSRLGPSNTRCLLPEMCKSQYCQDWKALVAYIRSLEASLAEITEAAQHLHDAAELLLNPSVSRWF